MTGESLRAFRWIVAVVAVFVFVGPASANSLEEVKAKGKLTMVSYPHQDNKFIHVNLEAGPMPRVGGVENFDGIDVDIMAAFAAKLGVELEVRPISVPSYGELIPALQRGEGDIVASSFSITAERQKVVDFSDPYFGVKVAVIAPVGVEASSLEDLAGKKAAQVSGSSQEELLLANGFKEDQILHVDFMRDTYLAISERRADFAIVDQELTTMVGPDFPKLGTAFYIPGGDDYGFAVTKGSDLLGPLNELIAEIKESGEIARIFKRHGVEY